MSAMRLLILRFEPSPWAVSVVVQRIKLDGRNAADLLLMFRVLSFRLCLEFASTQQGHGGVVRADAVSNL